MKKLLTLIILFISYSSFSQFEPNGRSNFNTNNIKNTVPKTLPIIKYKGEEKGLISFNGANVTNIQLDLIGSEIWVLNPIILKKKKASNRF